MYRCTGVLNYRGCFCGLSLRLPYTRSSHYCACSLKYFLVIKYRLAKNSTIIYHCTPNEFVEKNPKTCFNMGQYRQLRATKSTEGRRRTFDRWRKVFFRKYLVERMYLAMASAELWQPQKRAHSSAHRPRPESRRLGSAPDNQPPPHTLV